MTIPICDCHCQSCLYEDDCTACEFIVDEPEFRERHPVTNDEDEAAIAANRRDEQCIRCGTALTADDPATLTLGPRCTPCWLGRVIRY